MTIISTPCGCSSAVERLLPKQNVVGSSPITRSQSGNCRAVFFVAEGFCFVFLGENLLDLLQKSGFGLEFQVVDSGNEIEAQLETLSPIAIPLTQDTKHLQFANHVLAENTPLC